MCYNVIQLQSFYKIFYKTTVLQRAFALNERKNIEGES